MSFGTNFIFQGFRRVIVAKTGWQKILGSPTTWGIVKKTVFCWAHRILKRPPSSRNTKMSNCFDNLCILHTFLKGGPNLCVPVKVCAVLIMLRNV